MNKMMYVLLSALLLLMATGCAAKKSESISSVNINKTFNTPVDADDVSHAILAAADKNDWTLIHEKRTPEERIHRFKKSYEMKSENYHRATLRGNEKSVKKSIELLVTHSSHGYIFETSSTKLNSRLARQVHADIEKLKKDFYINLLPSVI